MKTVKLRGEDLARILHNALLVVRADEDVRPGLNAVRLLVREKRVHAIGCDPYTVAIDSADPMREGDPAESAPEPFELSIPRELAVQVELEVKARLRRYRKLKQPTSTLLVQITDADATRNRARIDTFEQVHEFSEPAGFPKGLWSVLYPEITKPYRPTVQSSFSIGLLARLQKVEPAFYGAILRFRGELNPIEIAIGPTFRAMLMPIRIPGRIAAASAGASERGAPSEPSQPKSSPGTAE